jgi:hypothetical protein
MFKRVIRVLSVALAVSLFLPATLSVQGCSSAKKRAKAGGAKGATAAKSGSQKAGASASGKKDQGTAKGADLDGVSCGEAEGVGFCSSDTEVTFCSGGTWYALACDKVEAGAFCGQDVETNAIDCFTSEE